MKKFEDFYKMTLVHFGTVSQKTGLMNWPRVVAPARGVRNFRDRVEPRALRRG